MTVLVAVPDKPDNSALLAEANKLVLRAQDVAVVDADSYAYAGEFGKAIKSFQKEIVEKYRKHKANAYKSWKDLCADEAKDLGVTERAESILKEKMRAWKTVTEAAEAEAQRRREETALRLEEERQLQEAVDTEEDGDATTAALILNEPIQPPAIPFVPSEVPKVAGVSTPKRWTYDEERVDLIKAICHIAGVEKLAHPELATALALDKTGVRRLITAMRENFNIPGIRAYQADGMSFGSK